MAAPGRGPIGIPNGFTPAGILRGKEDDGAPPIPGNPPAPMGMVGGDVARCCCWSCADLRVSRDEGEEKEKENEDEKNEEKNDEEEKIEEKEVRRWTCLQQPPQIFE